MLRAATASAIVLYALSSPVQAQITADTLNSLPCADGSLFGQLKKFLEGKTKEHPLISWSKKYSGPRVTALRKSAVRKDDSTLMNAVLTLITAEYGSWCSLGALLAVKVEVYRVLEGGNKETALQELEDINANLDSVARRMRDTLQKPH